MPDVIYDPPPQAIQHPGLNRLLGYWNARCAGRSLPGRGDIDPLDIPALLPNLMLIDVAAEPLRMTYRLVGTALVGRMGRDTTGLSVQDGYLGSDWEKILPDYLYVIGQGRPCLRFNEVEDARGRPLAYQRLLLPLARDGRQVDMILAAAFWVEGA
jgi:hypothetical protein